MYAIEVIQQARRTGYYRRMNTGCLMEGQSWVVDQMTGEGHVEGNPLGYPIGYFAKIEMWNGYTASLYMSVEQIKSQKNHGPLDDYVLAELIKNHGLQAYQGEIKNEQPEQSISNY